jgi:glycosyltransferase involved in cell wall biosynthesis
MPPLSRTGASRVLMIAPYFPPVSVVGARRPLMLVRHLPRHGWHPVVLAARPGLEPIDPTLSDLVPADIPVVREYGRSDATLQAGSHPELRERRRPLLRWDAGYLTPLDRYLWSTPAAFHTAMRLVHEYRPRVVHVCADPWSPLLAGLALKRRTGLPLVVDLRDPWSLQASKMVLRPPPTRWAVRAIEARVFRAASKVVLNSEDAREAYVAVYRDRIPEDRFTVVRNAFDLELFDDRPAELSRAFTVLHFGHFRRLVPGEPLLRGFARFVARAGLSPETARLRLVGGARDEDRAVARELGLESYLDYLPTIPYRQGLPLLRSADVLALVSLGENARVIPAKLYDYFAARRPILAITDQAEPARLVTGAGAGLVAPPADPERIAAALSDLRRVASGPDRGAVPEAAVAPFAAAVQAERFAAVLNEVAT